MTVTCALFDPSGPPAGPTTEQAVAMLNLIAARAGRLQLIEHMYDGLTGHL